MKKLGNAAPITDDTNPLNRNYNDPILWGSLPDWNTVDEAGVDQRTPDLTDILQAVIDRGDWKSGNAVLFGLVDPVALNVEGFTGNTSKRVARSYDRDPNQAAKLVVSFFPSDVYQTGSFPISKGASWKYQDAGTDLSTVSHGQHLPTTTPPGTLAMPSWVMVMTANLLP